MAQPEENSQHDEQQISRFLGYSRFLGIALRKSRILAYSTEVAESVRHSRPKWVTPLYVLNFAYIGVDISYHTHASTKYGNETTKYKLLDLLVFHTFASFVIPTATIHSVVKYTRKFCLSRNFSQTITTRSSVVAGLGMIPFIVHPIDSGVEYLMDKFLRVNYPDLVQKNIHAYLKESSGE